MAGNTVKVAGHLLGERQFAARKQERNMNRTPFVMIMSSFYEPNVNKVIEHLQTQAVKWFRFNTETFPLLARIDLRHSKDDGTYSVISFEGQQIDSRSVTSIWFRRQGEFILPEGLTASERDFVESECKSFLGDFYNSLDGIWVNPRYHEAIATSKLYQQRVARELGMTTPRTLVTNDPHAVREFVESTRGRVLFKPNGGVPKAKQLTYASRVQAAYAGHFSHEPAVDEHSTPPEQFPVLFSQILTEDKMEMIDHVSSCPVIFQDYIEKQSELRITIVGDDVFAAEIHSQESDQTKVDFREFAFLPKEQAPRHTRFTLPPEVEAQLMNLMERLHLVFGCIDMIRTIDGQYVFLEINPSGQWGWIEHFTGFPITQALASLLARSGG